MAVEIIGLSRLQAKLKRLDPLTSAAASRGVNKAIAKVEGDAKMIVPVDTGALRSSIHVSSRALPNGAEGEVSTSLEYAPYVELGTSRMRAQPYLQPALQKNKKTATSIIVGEIRAAYKGL